MKLSKFMMLSLFAGISMNCFVQTAPTAAVAKVAVPAAKAAATAAMSPAEAAAAKAAADFGAMNLVNLVMNLQITEHARTINPIANPLFVNINFGSVGGFSFFSDVWGKGTLNNPTSGSVASNLLTLPSSWKDSASLVMLAFDSAGNFIKSGGNQKPALFYMLVYDRTSQKLIQSPILIPLTASSKSGKFSNTWSDSAWQTISAESSGGKKILNTQYPAAITLTPVIPPIQITILRGNGQMPQALTAGTSSIPNKPISFNTPFEIPLNSGYLTIDTTNPDSGVEVSSPNISTKYYLDSQYYPSTESESDPGSQAAWGMTLRNA
ncbi:MAG: hypothetical protein NTZ68_00890 [Candidatus Dependentiae bacterium]|nr:hypothetical protein [Candidatus Dependentiae bacterium]